MLLIPPADFLLCDRQRYQFFRSSPRVSGQTVGVRDVPTRPEHFASPRWQLHLAAEARGQLRFGQRLRRAMADPPTLLIPEARAPDAVVRQFPVPALPGRCLVLG